MSDTLDLNEAFRRLETRLDAIDEKLAQLTLARRKSMEWIANLSEQISSLDAFREEVRASFEAMMGKVDNMEELSRILRHATNDVSRRIEAVEHHQKAG